MTNNTTTAHGATVGVDLDKLEALALELRSVNVFTNEHFALADKVTSGVFDLINLARRAEPSVTAADERARVHQEDDEFTEWWNAVQACPEHSLITENAARATWHERARRAAIASPAVSQPRVTEQALSVELMGVREEMGKGSGFWSSCSGCYDTEDGHPTGPYSYSSVFGCALGSGCSECGGIGAVWDNTDYEAMAADWNNPGDAHQAASEAPAYPAREAVKLWDSLPDAKMPAPAAQQAGAAVECGKCNDTGIIGFPPDQYESCPDCTPADTTASASGDSAPLESALAACQSIKDSETSFEFRAGVTACMNEIRAALARAPQSDADKLAEAIHAAAVKAGIIEAGTVVSGPQLVMLCGDLARAPLPAQGDAPAAWMVGLDVFKTREQAEAAVRNPDIKPMPLYIAAPAQAGDARDAEIGKWLIEHGFKYANVDMASDGEDTAFVVFHPRFYIPEPAGMSYEDGEWTVDDIRTAIRAAMSASQGKKGGAA